jgi:hypothetical protein
MALPRSWHATFFCSGALNREVGCAFQVGGFIDLRSEIGIGMLGTSVASEARNVATAQPMRAGGYLVSSCIQRPPQDFALVCFPRASDFTYP